MRDTRDAASRHQLTGLVATYRAHHYDLDIFTDDEARELLASHIGRDRIDAEPDTVTRLLAYCAGLPLAISIVAARASIHWRLSLSTIVDELHSHTERLDGFDGGDPATDLGRVLSWSYDALPVEAAAVFELLGLVPGPDISLPAIASLTKLSPAQAQKTLRALDNAYLVHQYVPGRYRMHDLIRLYANDRARCNQRDESRNAALRHSTTRVGATPC